MQPRREERRLVTCLFIDVVGSTELTMRLGPERLKAALDGAFGDLSAIIVAQGGTVEKYIGDEIYALFGAPVAHPDDPVRALRAAAGARDWAAGRAAAEIPFSVRVGVETGEAVVDLAAAEDTRQQMSVGAVVNIASRLQQLAEPGQVLVGPVAHDAARDAATFRNLGDRQVRGVGTLRIHLLDAVRAETPRRRLPFVGRESELDLLRAAYRRASSGRAVLALVSGPPGQGKTRLVEEFAASSGATTFLAARCRPSGEVGALAPLRELLVGDRDETELGARLDALFDDPRERARVGEALAHSGGLRRSESVAALAPDERDDEIVDAWRRWLRALAARGPVVASLEDVHWADASVVRLVDRVTSGGPGPLLFVATARPEFAESAGLRPSGDRFFIELDRLEPGAALALARASGGDEADAERAEGNPLFTLELARHRSSDDALPVTLQGALGARLDELAVDDRTLLAHAAVVGETFTVADAASLTGRDPAAASRALARLADLHYLAPIDGRYRFHHSLLRDVAYGRLLLAERMRLHARLARSRTKDPEVEAHHWWAALRPPDADWVWKGSAELPGMRRAAFATHLAAGRSHAEHFAVERAVALLERALTLADEPAQRAEAYAALGDAFRSTLRADEGWAAYRSARDAYREAGAPPSSFYLGPLTLRMASGAFHQSPPREEIAELLDEFEAAARAERDDRLIALALMHRSFDQRGDFQAAADLGRLDEAVALAERSGDRKTLHEVLSAQARALIVEMDVDGAEAALARAERLEVALDDSERLDLVRGRAYIALRRGDLQELERLARLADDISRPMGPHVRTHGLAVRSYLALAKGDWDESVRLGGDVTQIVASASGAKFCGAAGHVLANAAIAHSVAGREEEARGLAGRIANGVRLGLEAAAQISGHALMLTSADVPDLDAADRAGVLHYLAARAVARRRHARALELADGLERLSTRGARLYAAFAEAVREEVAADEGGPGPRHAALKEMGFLGWSEILGRRAPAPH